MKKQSNKKIWEFVWKRAFLAYQKLKEEENYILDWEQLKEQENKCRRSSNDEDRVKNLLLLVNLSLDIKKKWDLRTPISPYLRLKLEDWRKTVRPNSSLAKFIYAFGIDTNPELSEIKKNVKIVSERTLERDTQFIKFLCFTFITGNRATYRQFARIFKVDKYTVKKWVEEVKDWSESKRKAVSIEILTHKYLPDIDVLHLSKHFKTSLSKLGYGLSKDGLYDDGRKLKHKSSDESEED